MKAVGEGQLQDGADALWQSSQAADTGSRMIQPGGLGTEQDSQPPGGEGGGEGLHQLAADAPCQSGHAADAGSRMVQHDREGTASDGCRCSSAA